MREDLIEELRSGFDTAAPEEMPRELARLCALCDEAANALEQEQKLNKALADSIQWVNEDPYKVLSRINVNEHTEQKDGLTYLSWAWAWDEVKKTYPDAVYKVWKDEEGRPYIYDENLGYMCFTSVTIEGETLEMWLPVMDGSNKAMKSEPYEIQTKYKTITVKAATMFDINKTIMRCLVKNLAMFGLGLYIYAGEDVPQPDEDELATKSNKDYLKSECTKRMYP